jgi:integrase/recombinase XerD
VTNPAQQPVMQTTRIDPTPWREAMAVYLNHLSSPATRRNYKSAIVRCCKWLRIAYTTDVAAGDLARYRAHLIDRVEKGERSPATAALRICALRGFWHWCSMSNCSGLTRQIIDFSLAGYHSTVITPYQVLSDPEVATVLKELRSGTELRDQRDRTMITLAITTGLRAQELVSVRIRDILIDAQADWSVIVRHGKGRKERRVPLHTHQRDEILQWLQATGRTMADAEQYIFYGYTPATPMSTRRFQQIVTGRCREAGIVRHVTPHCLRHTCAVRLLRYGANLVEVQRLLGHSNVNTTQRYLDHIEWAQMKKLALSVTNPSDISDKRH